MEARAPGLITLANEERIDTEARNFSPARPQSSPAFPATSMLRIAAWAIMAAAAVVVAGFVLYSPRRMQVSSRDAALTQLTIELDPGETVEATANLTRRYWWNYFHETPGVLVATERRLIWVGVSPRGLIERDASRPTEFDILSFTYDSSAARSRRVFFGTRPGIVISKGRDRDGFIVPSNEIANLRRVTSVIERRQAAITTESERERRRQEYAVWLARQPVYHDVKAGEALFSIAEQYGLTPDSLRALNGLTNDRIRTGQRLLVKRGT